MGQIDQLPPLDSTPQVPEWSGSETPNSPPPEAPSPPQNMTPPLWKRWKWITAFLLMIGLCGILVAWGWDQISGGEDRKGNYVTEVAVRGPFRITVTESGKLDSLNNSTLTNTVEGSTTIITIAPEGTNVVGPIRADEAGIVEEIIEESEDRWVVTVRSMPVLVRVADAVLYVPGAPTTYEIPRGKYTDVLVQAGEFIDPQQILAGDVVCELDSSMLVEKEKQQRILVTQAESDVQNAEENVSIQKVQNQSDIAAARLARDLAWLDLNKFREGEAKQLENELAGQVKLKEEELARAQEKYEYSKRLAKRGFKSQDELEADRIAVTKAEIELAVAEEKLRLQQDFVYERTIKELQQLAEESDRELLRVRRQAASALSGFQAILRARRLTYEVEADKLTLYQSQIAACRLVAPQEGKVVYANQQSRRSEPVVIEEGATVRERQAIINLPDFSQMKVDARIHESKVSMLKEGQSVRIRIDAYPDTIYRGVLQFVPDVPVQGNWPNTDLMLYETIIRIKDNVADLKPGMTAEIEILVSDRKNILQVPVQSVVAVGDKFVSFVRKPNGNIERRMVIIGLSNTTMVEILEGISEGDEVVMNPRERFADELSALDTKHSPNDDEDSEDGDAEGDESVDAVPPARPNGTRPNRAQGDGAGGRPNGQRPGSGGGAGQNFDPAAAFARMDANSDQQLSKDEVPQWMAALFDQADANQDGQLDQAEFGAAMKARRSQRQSGGGGGRP